jgi:hypothetical protein
MQNLASITEVDNFDTWKPAFERFEYLRNENGVSNPRIFRLEHDANRFIVVFDVVDLDKALGFLNSAQTQEAMKKIGVLSINFGIPMTSAANVT